MKGVSKIGLAVLVLMGAPVAASALPVSLQKAAIEPMVLPVPDFVVTTTEDLPDANVGDGLCDAAPNPSITKCTLRAAVQEAYESEGADVIGFACADDSCVYTLTRAPVDGAQLETGNLNVSGDVTILGLGRAKTIIDANGTDRAFITAGGTANFRNLSIRNGKAKKGGGILCLDTGSVRVYDSALTGNEATEAGGAIRAYQCEVSVERSTLSGNLAPEGGGISASQGHVVVDRSEFFENRATGSGGAIQASNIVLTKSLLADNRAAKDGGGLWLFNPDGAAEIVNVTFAGNTAGEKGGAVYNRARPASFDFVTFFKNAAAEGGAVFNHVSALPGQANLRNSLFAGGASGGNCAGTPVKTEGHNIDDAVSCGFGGTEDLSNTDSKLDPNGLGDHGGKTRTVALLTGSPAIDSGDAFGAPSTDQRGTLRPHPSTGEVDRGAFETVPQGLLMHQAQLTFAPTTVGTSAPSQTVTFQNLGNAAVGMISLSVSDAFDFLLADDCSGQSVLPGQSCTATVTFKPVNEGVFAADLMFTSTVGNGTISLQGEGTAAVETPPTPSPDGASDPETPPASTGGGKIGTVVPMETAGCSLIR
ncbi:MAG TPA: choice-of-anchor Q domain-containing protein [bacterium]|nr:choice-of-anchor Q domain-containing protein [bacterium]